MSPRFSPTGLFRLFPRRQAARGTAPSRQATRQQAALRARRPSSLEQLEPRQLLAIDVFQHPFGAGISSGTTNYAILVIDNGDSGYLKKNATPSPSLTFSNNSQFTDVGAGNQAIGIAELPAAFGSLSTIYVTTGSRANGTGSITAAVPGTTTIFSGAAPAGPNGIIPGTFQATVSLVDSEGESASALLLAEPRGGIDRLRVERIGGKGALPLALVDNGSTIGLTTGTVALRFDKAPLSVTLTPLTWGIYDSGPAPVSFTLAPGLTPEQRFLVDLSLVPASSITLDSPLNASRGTGADGFFTGFGGVLTTGQVVLRATNVTTNANLKTSSLFQTTVDTALINRPVAAGSHSIIVRAETDSPASFVVSENGSLAGSLDSPATSAAGLLSLTAQQADVVFAGTVNATNQTYLFQSPADDPRGYTWTTRSPSSGVHTGRLTGDTVGATLGNSAGGDVDLRTSISTLRFTSASTAESPVLPYTVDIQDSGNLLVDAVPSSGRPISLEAQGTLTLNAAIKTTGDLTLVGKNKLTISAPISAAAGTVRLRADELTTSSSVTAGAMRPVVLEAASTTGDVRIESLVRAGGTFKAPVRVATTSDVTLSGPQTIDGVAVVAGNRVLVKNQTNPAQNGIYVVAAGTWARATDSNTSSLLDPGFTVSVLEGTQVGNWTLANPLAPTLNQTALFFVPATATQTFTPVRAATTANIPLSGLQTIDGQVLVAGDRVLVKDQTNSRQNGLYIVSAGDWERASDANTSADLRAGSYVFVAAGTVNGGQGFMLDNDAPQVGITPLTFSAFAIQSTRTNPFTPANVLASVAAATTANIVLEGLQAVDGVQLAAGDRVLVKNQRDASHNGVYVVAAGPWTRALDALTSPNLARGTTVWVAGGINNGGTSWMINDTVAGLGGLVGGSPFVTGLSSTAALVPGMLVTGPGVPTGTTIAQIVSDTSIRLSFAATVTDPTANLSFMRITPVAVGTDPILFLPSGGLVTVTAGRSVTSGSPLTSRLQGAGAVVNAGRPAAGTPSAAATLLINTNVGRLFAAAPASVVASNKGAIDLFDVRTTVAGSIAVDASGSLTATAVTAAATGPTKGDVTLLSTTGDVVAATVTTPNGNVTLTADSGDVVVTKVGIVDANINTQFGTVTLTANRLPGAPGGNIVVDGRVVADGAGGDIVLSSNDGLLTFTKAATVTADDQLRIFTPAQTPVVAPEVAGKIVAARLSIEASFGAGKTSYPAGLGNYQVLEVTRTDPGAIDITSAASLLIEGASTVAGSITFSAPSLTIAGPVRPAGAASAIALTASAGNLNIDAPLTSPTTITLTAPAGRIAASTGARTHLLTATETLVVRAASAANLQTKVAKLDAELSAADAALTVVETDSLLIHSVKLALGGVADITVGSPAVGGSATIGLIDVGATGVARITAQENVLATIDAKADIRGARAELAATTGRIEVETSVDVLVASALQKNQSIKIADLGSGATPLLLESVAAGTNADVVIKSQRTLDAALVKTTGTVSLEALGAGSDILVGKIEATGNTVTLAAGRGIQERTPADPDADIIATTISLAAQTGSIDVHVDAAAVSAVTATPTAGIRIRDDGDLSVGDGGAGIVGGDVTLAIGGSLTQTKAITGGTFRVEPTVAGAGVGVILENPANDVGTVLILGGTKAVSFVDASGVAVDGLSGSSVTLRAAGTISQPQLPTAPITATTLSVTATAAGDVVLDNATNSVGTLFGSTVNGDFSFVAADGFMVGAPGIVAGTAAPGDGDVSLTATTGNLIVAANVTAENDRIALAAPAGTITQTAGTIKANVLEWTALTPPTFTDLQVNILGPNLTGPGDLTIGTAGQPITVASASTFDGTITILGTDIVIDGLVKAGGVAKTVLVDAGGTILFQSGGRIDNLDTLGGVSLQAGTSITAANFATQTTVTTGGSLAINAGGAVALKTDVGTLAATVAAGGLTIADIGSLEVSGITAASQAVSLSAASGITQSGPLVAGTLAASSVTSGVVLANPSNDVDTISGSTGTGNFLFVDIDGFTVGAAGIVAGTAAVGDGDISLTALSGDIAVDGNLTAKNDTITLNAFGGTITQAATSTITAAVLNWTATVLPTFDGTLDVAEINPNLLGPGDLVIGLPGQPITVSGASTVDGNIFIFGSDVTITGLIEAGGIGRSVIVLAGGLIQFQQDGRIVNADTAGTVVLTAATTITAANSGTVTNVTAGGSLTTNSSGATSLKTDVGSLQATTGVGGLTIVDVADLLVAGISAPGQAVSLTTGGGITQAGSIQAGSVAVKAGASVVLLGPANAFANLATDLGGNPLSLVNTVDVVITSPAGLAIGPGGLTAPNISLVTNGDVTQTGTIQTGGLTVVSNGGSVSLLAPGNAFPTLAANLGGGVLSLANTLSVAISSPNGLAIGSGGLTAPTISIVTAGDVTQALSGAVTTNALGITTGGGNASLLAPGNAFPALAANLGGGTLSLVDAVGVTVTSSAGLAIGSGGLAAPTIALAMAGAVTQGGAVKAGSLSITNSSGVVTLANAANDVTSVTIANAGRDVTYRDANAVAVGAAGIQGAAITLVAGGNITQTGAVTGSSLAVTNTGGSVILSNDGNAVGTVSIANAGRAVTYHDSGTLSVGSTGIQGGTIAIKAAGLSQTGLSTGAITGGSLAVTNTAGAVMLASAFNDLATLTVANGGRPVTYRDATGVAVGPAGIQGGAIALTVAGNLTQSGGITGSSLNVINFNGTVTLDTAANDVASFSAINPGRNVTYRDATAVEIGPDGLEGWELAITAGGLTQTGTVRGFRLVANNSAGGVVLENAANDLASLAVSNPGRAVSYRDANSLQIGTSGIQGGAVTLRTGGDLTQIAPLTAASLSVMTTNATAVSLPDAGNAIGSVAVNISDAALTLTNASAFGLTSATPLTIARVVGVGDVTVTAPALVIGPPTSPFPVLQSGTVLDLRGVTSSITLLNGGRLLAPQILVNSQVPVVIGGLITTTQQLIDAVNQANSLPIIPGFTYEIIVGADLTLTQPLQFSRPVMLRGRASGIRLTGSATAANGVSLDAGASGSRIRDLVFQNFTGTAVSLSNARNVAINDVWVLNSGIGLAIQDTSTGTSVQGSRFIGTGTAINLNAAQGAVIGGTQPGNVISGSGTGVFAAGFCTGSVITGLVFDTSPATIAPFNIGSARNLEVTGTVFQNVDLLIPTPPPLIDPPTPTPGRPAIDLNGNVVPDIIWTLNTGEAVAWLDGNPNTARVLGGGGGWTLAATVDSNADGVSDLVWRSPEGYYFVWTMSSAGAPLGEGFLGGGGGWELEATGDYNGDGKTDFVWRNAFNGANVMWLMDGTSSTSQAFVGGSSDWRLVSTDERFDADGDGRTDLIWRTDAAGVNVLWRMNGSSAISAQVLGGDATWRIVGTGDFDGDGKGDLLWRNSSNGNVIMQLLDNGAVRSQDFIGGDTSNTVGVTMDADRDGRTDIFWRNLGTGAFERWLMNGTTARSKTPIGGNSVWRLLGRPGNNA